MRPSHHHRAVAALAAIASVLALAACDASPARISGTLPVDEVDTFDSVGFVHDEDGFHFLASESRWTRVMGLAGDRVLLWQRDEPDLPYASTVLDLKDGSSTPLVEFAADTIDAQIVWGNRLGADGQVVGGVLEDDGTVWGAIIDPDSGEVERFERDGADAVAYSADGTVLAYLDSGMASFVRRDGVDIDIDGDDANRLLATTINGDGIVVGFASWGDDPLWEPLPRGFVARPEGDGYHAVPFGITGVTRTSVIGVTDDGRVAGTIHDTADSPGMGYVTSLDDPDGALERYPAPPELTALLSTPGTGIDVAGIDEHGRLYGTLFLTDPTPELWEDAPACGGHGHLHGSDCHCDEDFVQDPADPANCIPETDA